MITVGKTRICRRVLIEYEGGEMEVHDVNGGDMVVVTSHPGTIAHAKGTITGTQERVAQLLSTAVIKTPDLLRPFLYYLNNDIEMMQG